MLLPLLPYLYLCNEICDRLSLLARPVRIHSRIAVKGNSWARLWYFLRALDQEGRGKLEGIPLEFLNFWLGTKTSTLYQQLREGKAARAFQKWRVRRGKLGVVLGGLYPVTCKLGYTKDEHQTSPKEQASGRKAGGRKSHRPGIAPWGAVAEIQLFQILESLEKLRAIATGAATQRLQQVSRYAAWRKLPKSIRHPIHPDGKPRTFHLPQPTDFFSEPDRPSHDSAAGGIRFTLKISVKWVSVSKGFTPFGTVQASIARERGYLCNKTIRRHLTAIGVQSKQIIQTKAAYGKIQRALEWSSVSFAPEPDIVLSYDANRDGYGAYGYKLTEPSGGRHGDPYTFPIDKERMFKHGDRNYLYRQSLYNLTLKLCKMSASRKHYGNWLVSPPSVRRSEKKDVLQNLASKDKFSRRAGSVVSVIQKGEDKDSRRATKS